MKNERSQKTILGRLVDLRASGQINDFSIEIQSDPSGVDKTTGSNIHKVSCITIEKRNGHLSHIKIDSDVDEVSADSK